jgi:hypothetical protein
MADCIAATNQFSPELWNFRMGMTSDSRYPLLPLLENKRVIAQLS